jgi:ABC-type amino acid transport substrate-binding protein
VSEAEGSRLSRRGILKVGVLGGLTTAGAAFIAACSSGTTPPAQPAGSSSSGATNPGTAAAPAIRVSTGSQLGKILAAKQINIGITATGVPMSYRDASGKLVGFNIDLLNQLGKDLGVTVNYQDQEWAGLIPGVIAGKLDMAAAGLTNTPIRARSMFFSNPYIPFAQQLLVNTSKKRNSIEDYNNANARLVALQGSTESQLLQARFPKANYVGLPDNNAATLEVISGRADGGVFTTSTAAPFIKTNSNINYFDTTKPLSIEFGNLALAYGDWEFKNWIDEWLRYWNAKSFLSNTYYKWYSPFLGGNLDQIPRY